MFRIWVLRTVCGCRQFCVFWIICELLQPLRKISLTVVRISTDIPLFFLFWVFGVDLHHLRGVISSLRSDAGTTRGMKVSVLNFIVFSSLVNRGFWPLTHSLEYPWSSHSFPNDRTGGVSSSNCTVTNTWWSWTKTCAASWVCTSPLAVSTTLWCSWTFAKCPIHQSLSLFCSPCALMLLNRLRIIAPLVFSKWVPPLPSLLLEYKAQLCPHSWACKDFSPHPTLRCGRIFLGAKSLLVIFPRILARKDYAHEGSHFWIIPCDGPLFPEF